MPKGIEAPAVWRRGIRKAEPQSLRVAIPFVLADKNPASGLENVVLGNPDPGPLKVLPRRSSGIPIFLAALAPAESRRALVDPNISSNAENVPGAGCEPQSHALSKMRSPAVRWVCNSSVQAQA